MASASPSIDVENEVSCPICLECLTDPVVLDCGHSFCKSCINEYCETWETLGDLECPICKFKIQKGNFRRNWQLANLLEKIKAFRLSSGKEDFCSRHKEKLHLFCKEDEQLVCFVCERSLEHKGHTILLLEKAAQEHKDQIHKCLETLKSERKKILESKADAEKESQDLLKRTELERENTVALFRQLHEFLADQEKRLLFQLEEMEKDIAVARDKHLASYLEELSHLESLIQDMEEKYQKTDIEVLKDVKSISQRYQKKEMFENPADFPPELKWRCWNCFEINHLLEGVIQKFQDTLASGLLIRRGKVTLDPASASSHLILFKSGRGMTWRTIAQDQSEDPEKLFGFVLGSKGFTAGCHFWEVTAAGGEGWAVGVARRSVKGRVTFTPEEGIWAVGRWKGQYKAFIKGIDPPLTWSGVFRKIRVCLNYDGGRVAFFNAKRADPLYEFSGASFSGETLLPFFAVYGEGFLWLSP